MTETAELGPERERLRALLRRADALTSACVVVERDEWGYPEAKAQMLAVLEEMRAEAHVRFANRRQALGISSPTA